MSGTTGRKRRQLRNSRAAVARGGRSLEAGLGPRHPDLANTLNNLAVVCELTGNMADAEQFYRRAYAIASTVLEPDHELVATSERNLRDFCETHGRPFQLLKQPPTAALEREEPVAASAPVPIERPSPAVSQPPVVSRPPVVEQVLPTTSARPLPVGLLSAATLPHRHLHRGLFLAPFRRAGKFANGQRDASSASDSNASAAVRSRDADSRVAGRARGLQQFGCGTEAPGPSDRADARRACRGRSTTLQKPVTGRHLAVRSGEQSGRSGETVFLHPPQGGRRHYGPPSLVSRRPFGSGSRPQDSAECQQRVPHV